MTLSQYDALSIVGVEKRLENQNIVPMRDRAKADIFNSCGEPTLSLPAIGVSIPLGGG